MKNLSAEDAIQQAILIVETTGQHPLLSDASKLLHQAKEKIAVFTKTQKEKDSFIEFLAWASSVVDSWPEWKKNVLGRIGD